MAQDRMLRSIRKIWCPPFLDGDRRPARQLIIPPVSTVECVDCGYQSSGGFGAYLLLARNWANPSVSSLSQSDIGTISNTSRKQVNIALKQFESAGWLKRGYRSMTIVDRAGLTRFIRAKRLD
jgi:hypothetical protein